MEWAARAGRDLMDVNVEVVGDDFVPIRVLLALLTVQVTFGRGSDEIYTLQPRLKPTLHGRREWYEVAVPRLPIFVRIGLEPRNGAFRSAAINARHHGATQVDHREKLVRPRPVWVLWVWLTVVLVECNRIPPQVVESASRQSKQAVTRSKPAVAYISVDPSKKLRDPKAEAALRG